MKKSTQTWTPGALLGMVLTAVAAVFSDPATLEAARLSENAFTRDRTLGFYDFCVCLLCSFKGKSNLSAAADYFSFIKGTGQTVSQQAFSKRRALTGHTPFKKAFERTVEVIVGFGLKTRFGFVPVAVDGTHLQLPKSKEPAEFFGLEGSIPTALGLMSCLPLNDAVPGFKAFSIHAAERDALMEMLPRVKGLLAGKRPLIIGDRGYPSHKVIGFLEKTKTKFLFRCSNSRTFAEVCGAPMGTSTQTLKNGVKVKVHKFLLPGGGLEVLMTNAFSLSGKAMEKLYWMRWTIEGEIKFTKHCVGLSRLSGRKVNSILQDIYAAVTVANIAGAIALDADRQILPGQREKGNKYAYISKRGEIVGSIHRRVAVILAGKDREGEKKKQMRLLFRECVQNRTPIRKGRSFDRKLPKQKKYFPDNQRTN